MEFEKIDITQIVVALISLAGMIWGAAQRSAAVEGTTTSGPGSSAGPQARSGAGSRPGQPPSPRIFVKNNWPTLLICACSAVFVVNIAYTIARVAGGETAVTITSPDDKSAGEYMQAVRGTSEHISGDDTLWIVVVPHANSRYYPANKPVDMQVSGEWTSLVYLGLPETTGEAFDVLALVLDEQARSDFEDYVEWCDANDSWTGYEALPDGTQEYDRISLTRG